MGRYFAAQAVSGAGLYALMDLETGASAQILPEFGNNCLSLVLPAPDGTLIPVINDVQNLERLESEPNRYGTPILFPWPGSIPEGRYRFEDREHLLTSLGKRGSADHGFVNRLPWRVESVEQTDSCARLVSVIDAKDTASLSGGYPFDFRLTVSYSLSATGLVMGIEAKNNGAGRMPFGFGAHPFFTVPFASGSSRGECALQLDVSDRWSLDAILNQSNSHATDVSQFLAPVDRSNGAGYRQRLEATQFNNVYRIAGDRDGFSGHSLLDPIAGLEVCVAASPGFETLVVYTPPDRDVIAIEPWTCTVNAFNLAAQGVEGSGLIILEPGEAWNGWIRIGLRPVSSRQSLDNDSDAVPLQA